MIIKLVNQQGGTEIIEAAKVTTETLPCGTVEVVVYDGKQDRIGRYVIREEANVAGQWRRGYVMTEGKTFETFKQRQFPPVSASAPSEGMAS